MVKVATSIIRVNECSIVSNLKSIGIWLGEGIDKNEPSNSIDRQYSNHVYKIKMLTENISYIFIKVQRQIYDQIS